MPSPWVSRRVIYPLQERLLKRPTFAYLESLEESQWLERSEVEALQAEKLAALLKIASSHSPWHSERIRAAGLGIDDAVPVEQLRRLPLMTRAEARDNVDRIRWSAVPGGAARYNTGGSSGEPLIFYFGRWRQASDAAGRIRARRWWGVDVGDREVYLWGAPAELNKTDSVKTIRDGLLNQLVLNAFAMSAAAMDRYLEAIEAFRPRCVYGYASSLALLAARAVARGRRFSLPELRVVCATGEPLYAHQREVIREAFGVPVANEFGSRDIGFTAHETPHGQMLLMSESIILEIVDPEGYPVAVGELGEAVATGLCSEAQPFIRYRTGDMVRLSPEPCIDGRGLHVLAEVVGRSTDFVVRTDGTMMHALSVIYVLRDVEGVARFRFIQHTLHHVEVLVVPNSQWSEIGRSKVRAGLAKRLGDEVRIEIRTVDSIPVEASGKYRYVVSHVPSVSGLEDELRIVQPARASGEKAIVAP